MEQTGETRAMELEVLPKEMPIANLSAGSAATLLAPSLISKTLWTDEVEKKQDQSGRRRDRSQGWLKRREPVPMGLKRGVFLEVEISFFFSPAEIQFFLTPQDVAVLIDKLWLTNFFFFFFVQPAFQLQHQAL